MNRLAAFVVSGMFLYSFSSVIASDMVPFVIPADISPDSEIALAYQPLGEQDRLVAKEHFYTTDGRRVRMWGVNLSFGANFPTHEDAVRVAQRMAAFGVNSVRFHHMDSSKYPRGIWDDSGVKLHPEALDRLDFFINELAKCGIYADINLHVGKKFSASLDIPESNMNYDKMVGIFTPQQIEAQKGYARQLLSRKNKYRNNMTYAEDYAVGFVEITNEDSLFMWSADENLRNLPDFYANILQGQYNQWLAKKYSTQAELTKAWTEGSEPLGENILINANFEKFENGSAPTGWTLEQHAGCTAKITTSKFENRNGILIKPGKNDGTGWHLQLNQRNLKVKQGKVYSVTFYAASPSGRSLNVGVGQAHEPWENLGLYQTIKLEKKPRLFRMTFIARQDDDNARLNFTFGDNAEAFYLANITLQPGVEYSIATDESLDQKTVKLFGEVESMQRKIDRMVFLAETEKNYFDEMKRFIKEDLGCKSLVTGTIVFGPLGLYAQSDMDFVDSHAYWQHPRFPNRSWDPGDWLIDQKAMSAYPEGGTLFRMLAERLSGKPFTVTEYNHPAPLDSQAECVPMIASFAAAQDWDGVWLYTYSHGTNEWDRQYMNSYFDIDTNPAKWGFMPAGAKIFRNGGIKRSQFMYGGHPGFPKTANPYLDGLAQLHLRVDRNMLDIVTPSIIDIVLKKGRDKSNKTRLEWNTINEKGFYALCNDTCCALTGYSARFSKVQSPYSVNIQSPALCSLTIVSLDDKSILSGSGKILITACGRCENTGMQFSEDRSTVGKNWGNAPVCIEPVEGMIALPSLFSDIPMICKVLNPDGTVKIQFDVKNGIVPLKAEYGTMWYVVERKNPKQ